MEQQPIAVSEVRKAGAGVYTEITAIEAPSSAYAGSQVSVIVKVKNRYSIAIGIKIVGYPDYPGHPGGLYITGMGPGEAWANIPAGATQSFNGYFTMPSSEVILRAYSYYYTSEGIWYLDDQRTKNVSLSELEAQFQSLSVSYAKV